RTVTASVPRPELEGPVTPALQGLTTDEATTPEIVTRLMPPTRATLGPAALFYPPSGFEVSSREHDEASGTELADLLAAAGTDDLAESGIAHIESPAFVSRAEDGRVVAASGYRRRTQLRTSRYSPTRPGGNRATVGARRGRPYSERSWLACFRGGGQER